ncbi:hypothetical protein [Polyangium sp. 6x1]|uniref:pyroglutamyl-peptidase I family protein n=1 Tax=Polyangium sp. 6x1 TaxID=3042689 RepID=UPI0024832483|nr:hypothetical protein [Polyangium sp. 6x1]MDI1445228.1 hypothetical protein [Polyangium sp. 6x1]
MPLRILVTGFEPFGGAPHNPSGDAARALDHTTFTVHTGSAPRVASVRSLLLPVLWDDAAESLVAHIEATRPHVVISLGMAQRRFRVERIAGNARMNRPDNRHRYPRPERAQATLTFPTRLPVEPIEHAIREIGGEVEPSTHAGGYICDDVFFALMQTHQEHGTRLGLLRAGFIHVPNDRIVPSVLPQETLNEAILAAARVTVQNLTAEELRPLL